MTTVWFNGDWLDAGPIVDCRDRGILLGDGAFETLLTRDGRPAFLGPHLVRLRRGLDTLRIPAPEALGDLEGIVAALAARNGMRGFAVARITVTRGPGARGLAIDADARPAMLVSLSSAPPPAREPVRLHIATQRRYSGAVGAAFKATGGYLDNILAHDEARRAGADEALMLNEAERPVCAAAANLFLIDANGLAATPPTSDGAMPGVVRGLVLSGDHGVSVAERRLALKELGGAALFLTNSLRGVQRACLADVSGEAPDALQRLQSWYHARLDAEFERSP